MAITLAETGGAQAYVAMLLPALVKHFDVVVAAHGKGPLRDAVLASDIRFVGLRFVGRRISPFRDLLGLLELVSLFLRERPDIVHANSSKAGILGRLAAFVSRVPVRVFTVHGWAFMAHSGLASRGYLWAERLIGPLTTLVICPAESEKSAGVRIGVCRADRTVVISNAVDVHAMPRARVHVQPPLVVSVGRLAAPKDFSTLLHACALLKDQAFRVLIVGEGPDRAPLEAEIQRLGLAGVVELAGERDDVPAILASAQIFALATRSECLPLSVLEAMAVGLPVIAASVGGVPEAVVHSESGLLVPPGDSRRFADAIALLIADPALREGMGASGRARAEQLFDLPAFRAGHLAAYSSELRRARRPVPAVEGGPAR